MTDEPIADGGIALDDIRVDKLRDVAYSANVETGGKKDQLIDRLDEADVSFGPDGWTVDGDSFEVTERPTGSGPSDTTLLYGFTREATSKDFLDDLTNFCASKGLEVRQDDTESGKDTLKIVRPANPDVEWDQGNDESPPSAGTTEDGSPTCAGTTADGEPCQNPTEPDSDFCHLDSHGSDE